MAWCRRRTAPVTALAAQAGRQRAGPTTQARRKTATQGTREVPQATGATQATRSAQPTSAAQARKPGTAGTVGGPARGCPGAT